MRFLIAAMAALFAQVIATSAAAQTVPTPLYEKASSWLCLPGRADACSTPQPMADLLPDGFGPVDTMHPAKDPGIDCFMVYPTISRDPGMNSDLDVSRGEERSIIESQFKPFAQACRPFVPIYRQMTTTSVAAYAAGVDMTQPATIALTDVRKAFQAYLVLHNKGRPFVLIGHSQGALMLQQLIAQDIEGRPIANRMKLAIIPGFNVLVPQGKRVGGTFKSTPLCQSDRETGCVLSWVSFRENNVPPTGAMFGLSTVPGLTVGCTNPGRVGASGWQKLDGIWDSGWSYPVAGGPIGWSAKGRPPTDMLRVRGLVEGKCVTDGPRGYLAVRTTADPKDARTDRIGGEVGLLGMFLPGWGMHLADMNAPLADLVTRVAALSPVRPPARTDPLSPR